MPNLQEHIDLIMKEKFVCKHIPMGFDPDFYNDKVIKSNLPDDIDRLIADDKFNVGYAGAIGNVNLVHEIVQAARILKDEENIHFYILGDGPHKMKLIQNSKDLNNITFLSRTEKKYVNAFLVKCKLLLHPVKNEKIYRYGVSPNKWIDYMYSSRPILVSYNGYQSIINEADCGKFISANDPQKTADEIVNFSRMEKSELDKIGANGKKYLLKKLSYETLANEYAKLF